MNCTAMRGSLDGRAGVGRWRCSVLPWLTVVAATAFSPIAPAEPFSLGAHRLGMPYESVLNDPGYDCESLAGCFLYSVCRVQRVAELNGVPLEELSLYFQGERLSGLEGFFATDRYDAVQSALAAIYGQPSGAGAEGLAWEQGSQVLRLQRLARPMRASVILSERSFLGELTKTEGSSP